MVSVKKLEMQIEEANAIGRQNLTDKGVEVEETATTYEIMRRIAELSGGGNIQTIVEYIESTGTQYIDTGYVPNQNTKIVASFEYVNYPAVNGNIQTAFGCGDSNNVGVKATASYEIHKPGDGFEGVILYSRFGTETSSDTIRGILSDSPYLLELSENGIYLDGALKYTYSRETFPTSFNKSIYIFAHNNNGVTEQEAKLRLYSFRIFEGETLVRDFVPALDESGVICLYDNVTEAYFYNKGSGKFSGIVVHKSGIEPLDHAVTFTVDGVPYEVACVKNGNSVNAPSTEPVKDGLMFGYWENAGSEVVFPFTPTEDSELKGVFAEWNRVRKLTTEDISYGKGFVHDSAYAYTNPPYTLSASNRAGYFYQDIPIEYGYIYKFDFISTSPTAQMALCFLTQNSLDKMAKSTSFGDTYYDTGWKESGFEYEVPETYNNSPIRCVRMNFRMSPNNETVTKGFIQSITVSRKLID